MHDSSYNSMKEFAEKYCEKIALKSSKKLRILDVGSLDINGTYKQIFPPESFEYVGADIVYGGNVDVWLERPYSWIFEKESFDFVIAGQTIEHSEFPGKILDEMFRVCTKGGYACIISPSWGDKCYPGDTLSKAVKKAGFEIVDAYKNNNNPWYDSVVIAKKK